MGLLYLFTAFKRKAGSEYIWFLRILATDGQPTLIMPDYCAQIVKYFFGLTLVSHRKHGFVTTIKTFAPR
jgi:hypothetical protein